MPDFLQGVREGLRLHDDLSRFVAASLAAAAESTGSDRGRLLHQAGTALLVHAELTGFFREQLEALAAEQARDRGGVPDPVQQTLELHADVTAFALGKLTQALTAQEQGGSADAALEAQRAWDVHQSLGTLLEEQVACAGADALALAPAPLPSAPVADVPAAQPPAPLPPIWLARAHDAPGRAYSGAGMKRRRVVRGVLAALMLATVLAGGYAYSLYGAAVGARQQLTAAQSLLSSQTAAAQGTLPGAEPRQTTPQQTAPQTPAPDRRGLPAVVSNISSACTAAAGADAALQQVSGQLQVVGPLLGIVEQLPGVGERARAQTGNLQAGTQLASAGVSLCEGLGPLSALLSGQAPAGTSAGTTLESLVASRPSLLEAASKLTQLQASLDQMPAAQANGTDGATIAALRQRLPTITSAIRDSATLLDLLGSSGTRRYLLVSQNPDELRATGGYIGSAGVVEIEGGNVRLVEYGSSRAYDTPPSLRVVPPEPLRRYLGGGYWHLAGANWSPSFPDVAQQLEYFYSLSRPNLPVDGVIALNQVALARMLAAVGPVEVPEYGETVSADTLQATLERYVHDYETQSETGRKHFTAALTGAVIQQVLSAPPSVLPDLTGALRSSLEDEQLLLWVKDQTAAEVIAQRRWDARLLPAAGDALLLLDTEVRTSKQSQEVRRDAEYEVRLNPEGGAESRLTVTYSNQSDPTKRARFLPDYKTYLRVYAAPGATLLETTGFTGPIDTYQECGRTVFGGEVQVLTGEQAAVTMRYTLPPSAVPASGYDLTLQQQPGVPPGTLQVRVLANGTVLGTEVPNAGGQHRRWQVAPNDAGALDLAAAPLPRPTTDGCGTGVVQADPIAAPGRLEIPALGLSATVVEIGIGADGTMENPPTPEAVGWYGTSARAGQPGNSVMAGHLDWGGKPAVFGRLRDLQGGEQIIVTGTDGVAYTYTVTANESFPTAEAPIDRLLGGTTETSITLITCDGVWNRVTKDYSKRRFVTATLISQAEAS